MATVDPVVPVQPDIPPKSTPPSSSKSAAKIGPCCAACDHTEPETTIRFDCESRTITGAAKLRVKRPLAELVKVLDPQNWDVTMPKLLRRSWVVDCAGGACQPDAEFIVPAASSPPAPGSSWRGVLFEDYELGLLGIDGFVSFKNLLDVSSTPRADGHRFQYSLRKILHGRIGPLQQVGGGLDRDDGYIDVAGIGGGWSEVSATKVFRLTGWKMAGANLDWMMNWWTSNTIGTTLGAAYDAVCTEV